MLLYAPLFKWSRKRPAVLAVYDARSLLAADCEAAGTSPKKSAIKYDSTGKGVFSVFLMDAEK